MELEKKCGGFSGYRGKWSRRLELASLFIYLFIFTSIKLIVVLENIHSWQFKSDLWGFATFGPTVVKLRNKNSNKPSSNCLLVSYHSHSCSWLVPPWCRDALWCSSSFWMQWAWCMVILL